MSSLPDLSSWTIADSPQSVLVWVHAKFASLGRSRALSWNEWEQHSLAHPSRCQDNAAEAEAEKSFEELTATKRQEQKTLKDF